ncbi:MAG: DMT family transporter [Patescibacteria group bacterium]|nr:DMT family transporter [Patescibacteria group bacterium]
MNWLLIAISAHFLLAVVFAVDKFLLSKTVLRPAAAAFYVGLLSGSASLLLIPLGFSWLSFGQIAASFIAGGSFVFAVLFFYQLIRKNEVSIIAPIVGAAVPIFTLTLTYFFLGERPAISQLSAFCLLVLGGVIILLPQKSELSLQKTENFLFDSLLITILTAFLFALSFVLTKFIFSEQQFINGFIWIRLGGILSACLLFLIPNARKEIFETSKSIEIKVGGLFISNKILSAFAFVLLNYAIYLGSVSLVNALQGVQYVFLLMIVLFLSKKFPQIIKEQISGKIIIQKIIAILFIAFGLGILVS